MVEIDFNTPKVLDAGMATGLEDLGFDLSGDLWSAAVLLEHPDAITQVHQSHIAAGADIITTASYQISEYGFIRVGRDPKKVAEAIAISVDLARAAVDGSDVLVAGSVGPYGAVLADGSEYRGDYKISREELLDFHGNRLAHFVAAAPDLLAFETIPSQVEISVITELLNEISVPAWISLSAKNGSQISDGSEISEVLTDLNSPNVLAVGVNCTKPEFITDLLIAASSPQPKIVYPNAGRTWDAVNRTWLDAGAEFIAESTLIEWIENGAKIIGGCCGLGTKQIQAVKQTLQNLHF